jgi:hypothetical protein
VIVQYSAEIVIEILIAERSYAVLVAGRERSRR